MKLGLFGGTFNPVHTGHVNLAEVCVSRAGLHKLLVMPAATPPHKAVSAVPDNQHRFAMCKLAFGHLPCAEVSDLELRRAGKSYTVDTLNDLRAMYPDDDLHLIVGSDMFFTLESWHRADEIKGLVTVLTMSREEDELSALKAHAQHLAAMGWRTMVCEEPPYVASSTAVRQGDIDLVPDIVGDYIAQNGLYGLDADLYPWDFDAYEALAREKLSEKRFYHSKCVEERAIHLAQRWGGSVPLCRVAGLLHDICKEWSQNDMLQMLNGSDRITDNIFCTLPQIWHGYAAAEYLPRALNIYSRPILNAVRFHTTARAAMSLTEVIVYLADLTSKDRTYDEVDDLRALCEIALGDAMVYTLDYFRRTLDTVCVETKEAFDYYLG